MRNFTPFIEVPVAAVFPTTVVSNLIYMNPFVPYAEILRCPATKEHLRFTDQRIEFDRFLGGLPSEHEVQFGYLNQSGSHFYPVIEGIICMLPFSSNEAMDDQIKGVKAFYEDFGWKRDAP